MESGRRSCSLFFPSVAASRYLLLVYYVGYAFFLDGSLPPPNSQVFLLVIENKDEHRQQEMPPSPPFSFFFFFFLLSPFPFFFFLLFLIVLVCRYFLFYFVPLLPRPVSQSRFSWPSVVSPCPCARMPPSHASIHTLPRCHHLPPSPCPVLRSHIVVYTNHARHKRLV